MSNPNKKLLQVFAHYYHSMGMNILPVYQYRNEEGKLLTSPFRGAKALRSERQSFGDLLDIKWEKCVGIGSVCGYDNWRCLEFQNSEDIDFIRQLMQKMGLATDYPWLLSHRKKKGCQLWFKTNNAVFPFKKARWVFQPLKMYERYFEKLYLYWERTPKLPVTLKVHVQDEITTFKHFPREFPAIVDTDTLKAVIEQLCIMPEESTPAIVADDVLEEENEAINEEVKPVINHYLVLNLILNQAPITKEESKLVTVGGVRPVTKKITSKEIQSTAIVKIAWAIYDKSGQFIHKKQYLIKPNANATIHENILQRLKISQEEAAKNGYSLKNVLKKLLEELNDTSTIISHGLHDKLSLLEEAGKKAKIDFAFDQKKQICTEERGLKYCGVLKIHGYDAPNLNELHKKLYFYQFSPEFYKIPKSETIIEELDLMATCFWEMRRQLLA